MKIMNDMISVCLFPQIFLPLPLHDKINEQNNENFKE